MSIDLFNGLLHWVKSRKEGYRYVPAPVYVKEIILEANGLFLDNQKKKNVAFKIEIPDNFIIYAHQQMLLFIFRNIINNATKHAATAGEILIYSETTSDENIISIKDKGNGIHPEKLKNLFKIDNSSQQDDTGGAGVALVISHSMMHQMGGRIWVDSELGKGTIFHLALPTRARASDNSR
jgi:signal transduction histidine kinase